jgi:hypothetical protein
MKLTKIEENYLLEYIEERLHWAEISDGEDDILISIKRKIKGNKK